MASMHSPTADQELFKLSPEVRKVLLDMYEREVLETLAEKQAKEAEQNKEEQYNTTDAEKLSA